jgi:enhancing lycopene biosynthesis protein 2
MIVTTPAYMLASRISQVYEGIGKCVQDVCSLI